MIIKYLNKHQMIEKWDKNYFGLTYTEHADADPEIYIRSDLPKCVQKSVLGHEEYHATGKHDEFGAWVAGAKAHFGGFLLGIVMSLTPSRLKMYPELVSAIALITVIACIIIFGGGSDGG